MRKHIVFGLILGILLAYGASKVHAQATTAATPYSIQVTGTLANCPTVAAGTTQYCFAVTGLYQSINGASWALLGGVSVVPTLTLNGTTKALPGPFTIAAGTTPITAN